MQKLKDTYASNPEEFKGRGKVKPEHHFTNINLQDAPEHAKQYSEAVSEAAPSAPAASINNAKPQIEEAKPINLDLPGIPEHIRAKFAGGKK